MPTTVYVFSPDLGDIAATPKIELYPIEPGTILNGAGGDALTAVDGKPGWWSATVAETITGIRRAVLTDNGTPLAGDQIDMDAATVIYGRYGGELSDQATADIVAAIRAADIPVVRYSNVDAEGRIFVTQNADHYATDGFGLEITVEGFDGDLSNAASYVLKIASGGVTESFTTEQAPSTGSGTGSARYTFNFDLPRSQMANLEKGTGTYDLFAVLANGHQIPVLVEQQARIYGRL